jgi:hypothetical protein
MTLEQAWNLIEHLNYDANRRSKDLWLSYKFSEAVSFQAACFRKNFLDLDKTHQELIQHWINTDDEFQDYFKCLSGNE